MTLAVFAILYTGVIALLVQKLRDVYARPAHYDETPGWDRYDSSFWFPGTKPRYILIFEKGHFASLIICLPLAFCIMAAGYFITVFLQETFFRPQEALLFFRTDSFFGGMFFVVFFAFVLPEYFCLHMPYPVFEVIVRYAFNSRKRNITWKKILFFMLAGFVLLFPFYAFSFENYVYATPEKLVYDPFFPVMSRYIITLI